MIKPITINMLVDMIAEKHGLPKFGTGSIYAELMGNNVYMRLANGGRTAIICEHDRQRLYDHLYTLVFSPNFKRMSDEAIADDM